MFNDFISKLIIILIPAVAFIASGSFIVAEIIKTIRKKQNILEDIINYFWPRFGIMAIIALLVSLLFGLFYNWIFAAVFLIGVLLSVDAVSAVFLIKKKNETSKTSFKNSFILSIYIFSSALLVISILYFLLGDIVNLIGILLGVSLIALFINIDENSENYIKKTIDFFDTYVLVIVSSMLLGYFMMLDEGGEILVRFPLIVTSIIFASLLISIFLLWSLKFVILKYNWVENIFYKWIFSFFIFSLIFLSPAISYFVSKITIGYSFISIFYSILFGLVSAFLIIIITRYYLDKKSSSVKLIANIAKTNAFYAAIKSFFIGAKATFLLMVIFSAVFWGSYQMLAFYGVALSILAALSLIGIILTIYFYFLDDKKNKDIENSGYALFISISSLLLIFVLYTKGLMEISGKFFIFDLANYQVFLGLVLGSMFAYVFSSYFLGDAEEMKNKIIKNLFFLITPFLFVILAQLILGPRGLGGMIMGVIIAGSYLVISLTFGSNIWEKVKIRLKSGEENEKEVTIILNSMIKIIGVATLVAMLFL